MRALRWFNRQRARPIDRRLMTQIGRCLLEELLERTEYQLAVHFIGAAEMAKLNQSFLGHEGSTDVITFNHLDGEQGPMLYGEIFISVDDAVAYAKDFGVTWQSEITRYFVHGVLHLEGCDDLEPALRRVMKRKENQLLKKLSQRFDLDKLQRSGHAKR